MTSRDAQALEEQLRELLATVADGDLRGLLDDLLGAASPTWIRFRDAPAAKRLHQAYRHGLLEHTLTVAQGVSALAAIFPGLDRDLALTGALLHDIGKLDTYAFVTGDEGDEASETIELTDAGRLQGEIVLGAERVRAAIDARPGFSPRSPSSCCTSSSATTARSPTAARSCRSRARRRSCTWSTTSAAGSAASTGSSRSCRRRAVVGLGPGDRFQRLVPAHKTRK